MEIWDVDYTLLTIFDAFKAIDIFTGLLTMILSLTFHRLTSTDLQKV